MKKLTYFEFEYLIGHCKENRKNSAELAEVPGQKWKEAHKAEVKKMDSIIKKLEAMQAGRCNG